MKIVLKNFRCWRDNTIDFGESGIVLLNGPSGKGKTSILNAIYFALYGIGTKITTTGEKKCIVVLYIDNLVITRTKGPNRLLVYYNDNKDIEYEDLVAQECIDRQFGKHFNITSYIVQKSMHSFLSMSPTEKLKFLENISMDSDDIESIKNSIKNKIKTLKELQVSISSRIDTLSSQKLEQPSIVHLSIGKYTDIKEKNNTIRLKKASSKIKSLSVEKKSLESKLRDQQELHRLFDRINIDIDRHSKDKKKYIVDDRYIGDSSLEKHKHNLSILKKHREYKELKSTLDLLVVEYETLYSQYKRDSDSEIRRMKESIIEYKNTNSPSILRDRISTLTKIHNMKREHNQIEISTIDYDGEIKKYNSLNNELNLKNTEMFNKINILECPYCSGCVVLKDKILEKTNIGHIDYETGMETINRNKNTIKSNSRIIQGYVSEKSRNDVMIERKERIGIDIQKQTDSLDFTIEKDIKSYISELQEEYDNAIKNNEAIKSIEKKISSLSIVPPHIISIESKKNRLQTSISTMFSKDNLKSIDSISESMDTLTEIISVQSEIKYKNSISMDNLNRIEKSILSLEKEKKSIYLSSIDDIQSKIDAIDIELESLNEEVKLYNSISGEISTYKEFLKRKSIYDDWIGEISFCENKKNNTCIDTINYEKLYKKVLEAESVCLSNTLESINHYANIFLDKFFPDNPLCIKLIPYKETKTDIKPCINIEVYYKDSVCTLDSLSGGEYDRVSLSIVLSLNKLYGGKILLLDESISSLDSDLTLEIVETLKEDLSDKLVVVVSHQVNSGMFDKIIDL